MFEEYEFENRINVPSGITAAAASPKAAAARRTPQRCPPDQRRGAAVAIPGGESLEPHGSL